jgi:ferredoxin/flavodoxin---NADP+ reductase
MIIRKKSTLDEKDFEVSICFGVGNERIQHQTKQFAPKVVSTSCLTRISMDRNQTLKDIRIHNVIEVRNLTKSTYVLRLERNGLQFNPGQYLSIGIARTIDKRDYSIYSSPGEDYLELLIREVRDGMVSRDLRKCKPGDKIEVEGPFGFFQLKEEDIQNKKKFLFIATGTGISPFHSIILNNPGIDYTLLHGVSYAVEGYEKQDYDPTRHVLCVSREGKGDFYGRVTDYMNLNKVDSETVCYLCGNCDMINDAFDILEEQGVLSENIHAEVYF